VKPTRQARPLARPAHPKRRLLPRPSTSPSMRSMTPGTSFRWPPTTRLPWRAATTPVATSPCPPTVTW